MRKAPSTLPLSGRWRVTYFCIVTHARGIVTLDNADLSQFQAYEIVNAWNDRAHGRWVYVLLDREIET